MVQWNFTRTSRPAAQHLDKILVNGQQLMTAASLADKGLRSGHLAVLLADITSPAACPTSHNCARRLNASHALKPRLMEAHKPDTTGSEATCRRCLPMACDGWAEVHSCETLWAPGREQVSSKEQKAGRWHSHTVLGHNDCIMCNVLARHTPAQEQTAAPCLSAAVQRCSTTAQHTRQHCCCIAALAARSGSAHPADTHRVARIPCPLAAGGRTADDPAGPRASAEHSGLQQQLLLPGTPCPGPLAPALTHCRCMRCSCSQPDQS